MGLSLAYAPFMLLALAVFVLARRCFPAPGSSALTVTQRRGLAVAGFVGGVLGAKLPFAFDGDDWLWSAWLADGKTVTTGLVGAYLGVELAKWVLGVQTKTGDGFALPLALSLAVGRLGCFFHGCCHGIPTDLPWGVDFGDSIKRHPTQLYESLFHLAMSGILLIFLQRGWFRNQRLKFYLIGYAVFRFATELIRPEPRDRLGLTYYQWVALLGATALALQWWYDSPSARPSPDHRLTSETA